MTARSLMFQGAGSDVDKSIIVVGLCRLASNRGIRVVLFKPQNMSNNAAVCDDGGKIDRAQALQALACRLPNSAYFNPVLLKPQTDRLRLSSRVNLSRCRVPRAICGPSGVLCYPVCCKAMP